MAEYLCITVAPLGDVKGGAAGRVVEGGSGSKTMTKRLEEVVGQGMTTRVDLWPPARVEEVSY